MLWPVACTFLRVQPPSNPSYPLHISVCLSLLHAFTVPSQGSRTQVGKVQQDFIHCRLRLPRNGDLSESTRDVFRNAMSHVPKLLHQNFLRSISRTRASQRFLANSDSLQLLMTGPLLSQSSDCIPACICGKPLWLAHPLPFRKALRLERFSLQLLPIPSHSILWPYKKRSSSALMGRLQL